MGKVQPQTGKSNQKVLFELARQPEQNKQNFDANEIY